MKFATLWGGRLLASVALCVDDGLDSAGGGSEPKAYTLSSALERLEEIETTPKARDSGGKFAKRQAEGDDEPSAEDLDVADQDDDELEEFDDEAEGEDEDVEDPEGEEETDDEGDEDQDDDEGEDEDPVLKIEIDGEEVEVAQSELVETYKQLETAKTEIVEAREVILKHGREIAAERKIVVESLLPTILKEFEGLIPSEEDVKAVMAQDVVQGLELKDLRAHWLNKFQDLGTLRDKLAARAKEQADAEFAEEVRAGQELLPQYIPEWKDPVRRLNEMRLIGRYLATQYNLTQEDLGRMTNPIEYAVALKAMKWDEAQANKQRDRQKAGKALRQPQPAPKTAPKKSAKPSAARARSENLKSQLAKTGDQRTALALMAARGL